MKEASPGALGQRPQPRFRALRNGVKAIPLLGPVARWAKAALDRGAFTTSGAYWEERYAKKGDSGAGSYGRLAEFKANVINEFVRQHAIQSIIEFGCGDGAQLQLALYPQYVGVDISPTIIDVCRQKFKNVPNFQFFVAGQSGYGDKYDLSISIDVLYHLVEDDVFEAYMQELFRCAEKFVIIYSSDGDGPPGDTHVKHRPVRSYVSSRFPDWSFLQHVPNAYPFDPASPDDTSWADFFIFGRR